MRILTEDQRARMRLLVEALRSGQYKQTTRKLRRDTGTGSRFCCLGVACEIFRQQTGQGEWLQEGYYSPAFMVDYDLSTTRMPTAVCEWFGGMLGDFTLFSENADGWDTAAMKNDSGWSFIQIADALEATYLRTPSEPTP